MLKYKPILFSTEMVQAILEGRKTVTRRLIKNIPSNLQEGDIGIIRKSDGKITCYGTENLLYQVGDILYVRETFGKDKNGQYQYRADYPEHDCEPYPIWHPSIHMPKLAARIFLKVTDIRVERLQDISCLDAISEGVKPAYSEYENCNGLLLGSSFEVDERETIKRFGQLWDSTIKKQSIDKYSWNANPWVWIIEFERVEVTHGV